MNVVSFELRAVGCGLWAVAVVETPFASFATYCAASIIQKDHQDHNDGNNEREDM
jgi:hypothetical protein